MSGSVRSYKGEISDCTYLFFPIRKKPFHVHVDASTITLDVVLMQLREGKMDHPIYFASRKLSDAEINYTTIESEGLAMVYAL